MQSPRTGTAGGGHEGGGSGAVLPGERLVECGVTIGERSEDASPALDLARETRLQGRQLGCAAGGGLRRKATKDGRDTR